MVSGLHINAMSTKPLSLTEFVKLGTWLKNIYIITQLTKLIKFRDQ